MPSTEELRARLKELEAALREGAPPPCVCTPDDLDYGYCVCDAASWRSDLEADIEDLEHEYGRALDDELRVLEALGF